MFNLHLAALYLQIIVYSLYSISDITDILCLYLCILICVGLSILQNGKLPQFMSEDMTNAIFNNTSPCLVNLTKGFKKVVIFQVIRIGFAYLECTRSVECCIRMLKKFSYSNIF